MSSSVREVTPSPNVIFRLKDVGKVYETGAGGFEALKGISIDVSQGSSSGSSASRAPVNRLC